MLVIYLLEGKDQHLKCTTKDPKTIKECFYGIWLIVEYCWYVLSLDLFLFLKKKTPRDHHTVENQMQITWGYYSIYQLQLVEKQLPKKISEKRNMSSPLLSISFEAFSLREGIELKSLW